LPAGPVRESQQPTGVGRGGADPRGPALSRSPSRRSPISLLPRSLAAAVAPVAHDRRRRARRRAPRRRARESRRVDGRPLRRASVARDGHRAAARAALGLSFRL